MIVTKLGARRGSDASWHPAFSADDLTQAVHENLRNLRLDAFEVVNLRACTAMGARSAALHAAAQARR